MHVTKHGHNRIRQRAGIPKRAVERMTKAALEKGISPTDTRGSLKKYLAFIYAKGNGRANNLKIYANKVFVFDGEVLVTILNLPPKYQRLVARNG